ncbi:MAG TPA: hypothetical protein VL651_10095, partial [Bacteroidia bacterium]|nr:hypothetical protein [Bacteroidia bacterium]
MKNTSYLSRINLFVILASFLYFFNGCRNEIDINANYRNILVCYGILNPYDSVQYVRVDKVFLGTGNALTSAQYNDSISFSPGRLSVLMQQWYSGQLLNTYPMYPDTTIGRDSGLFCHPYQVLYKGTFPVLKDGSSYKVIVTDLEKGTTINAITNIPGDITMINPVSNFAPLNLWDTTALTIRFNSARYGYRYHMFLRFHYTEQFINDTTQQSQKYIDWNFGDQDANSSLGNEEVDIHFIRHNFFNYISGM